MAVSINGTTGISLAAGSASTPAIQGADDNTGIFFPTSNSVAISTDGNVSGVFAQSSGDALFGVGVTPTSIGAGFGVSMINGTTGSYLGFLGNSLNQGRIYTVSTSMIVDTPSGSSLELRNNNNTSLVINSSGAYGVGSAVDYGSAGKVLTSTGSSGYPAWEYPIKTGLAVSTTSGTSIDFTDIPPWVSRIYGMISSVSTNGTSSPLIRPITASGAVSSGYSGAGTFINTAVSTAAYASGFSFGSTSAATTTIHGIFMIANITSNIWVYSYTGASTATTTFLAGGTCDIGAKLTGVRLTTVGGTNTFDSGIINIFWE